jgi:L-cysteine S-thiosulfotransferase
MLLAAGVAAADERRSGTAFLNPETQAMQADDAQNPGMLWVAQGEALWEQSCKSCHGDAAQSMRGVATRYPAIDKASGKLLNLETRIQQCQSERLKQTPARYESRDLLSLSAFVAHQSRGLPIEPAIDGAAAPNFAAGKAAFEQRVGQLNLACKQCHDDNWGKRLKADTISQGHPTGYPLYRLEWNGMGSLHRRLRFCNTGVRAEPYALGAPEYVDLELYLAWRARGMPLETPAVRR